MEPTIEELRKMEEMIRQELTGRRRGLVAATLDGDFKEIKALAKSLLLVEGKLHDVRAQIARKRAGRFDQA